MRPASRDAVAAPGALDRRDGNQETELDRARRHVAAGQASFPFAAYKDAEVKRQLEQLFHGKCAYCETRYASSAPVDVEHFRPKGAVSEDPAHPGYWWLAAAWSNLLPSCIDCNRKRKQILVESSASLAALRASSRPNGQAGKKDSFPIRAGTARLLPEAAAVSGEAALLINPCDDVPGEHLEFVVDGEPGISLVLPRGDPDPSLRGATSIQVYGLNRLGLVQDRTRVLRQLTFLGDLAIELGELVDRLSKPAVVAALQGTGAEQVANRIELLMDRILAEMRGMAEPDQPYSAMVSAWLDRFAVKFAGD